MLSCDINAAQSMDWNQFCDDDEYRLIQHINLGSKESKSNENYDEKILQMTLM